MKRFQLIRSSMTASMWGQELEWFGFLEVCRLVSAHTWIAVEGELANTRARFEVDLIEFDP